MPLHPRKIIVLLTIITTLHLVPRAIGQGTHTGPLIMLGISQGPGNGSEELLTAGTAIEGLQHHSGNAPRGELVKVTHAPRGAALEWGIRRLEIGDQGWRFVDAAVARNDLHLRSMTVTPLEGRARSNRRVFQTTDDTGRWLSIDIPWTAADDVVVAVGTDPACSFAVTPENLDALVRWMDKNGL